MTQERRRLLLTQLGGAETFTVPTYTGSHAIFGDEKQGYIECYSSGTLTFSGKGVVDAFILGSGQAGQKGINGGTSKTITGDTSSIEYYTGKQSSGGTGGAGAKGKSVYAVEVNKGDYEIIVASSNSSTGSINSSSAFGFANNEIIGNGGTGGKITPKYTYDWVDYRGSNDTAETKAKAGTNGTSYPFGETAGVFHKQLGAGGGGGACAAYIDAINTASGWYVANAQGGTLGGGNGGTTTATNTTYHTAASYAGGNATANTGSGGGGGATTTSTSSKGGAKSGGSGGSGIVIIRWGYSAA